MLTESDIEKFIDNMERQIKAQGEEFHAEFESYLEAEIYPNLTPEEAEVLHFCVCVIYGSLHSKEMVVDFDLDAYPDAEEYNWSLRDKDKSFEKSLELYFENYPEEDLLAFAEDMIVEDEDQELSIAGQEIIFITCKSYIDQQRSISA